MALTAYALSLVNSEVKILANNRLVQIALYDNGKLLLVKLSVLTLLLITIFFIHFSHLNNRVIDNVLCT